MSARLGFGLGLGLGVLTWREELMADEGAGQRLVAARVSWLGSGSGSGSGSGVGLGLGLGGLG